jgi:hypothetical protein
MSPLLPCVRSVIASLLLIGVSAVASAQEPPPKIGPFVFDLQATVPRFPSDQALAESRLLYLQELPGVGLGLHAGAHVYVLTWKALTIGLGADLTVARARHGAAQPTPDATYRAVTERFTHIAPEISFNFGSGNGWSYLSGGIGPGRWSLIPDGSAPALDANSERIQTINYGGGARWFIKRHVAFSLDVRFYAVNPTTPAQGLPGGPRTTLLFMGAGISVK